MQRYHFSDNFMIGGIDSRLFRCPSCPFEGGEDAMVQHAMDCGHIAQPVEDEELSRMADEGCPNS
jgi:hypothetical protein